jgi:PHD/YefM family antitoxin component YafN of YafNO toxin-antitoxin module
MLSFTANQAKTQFGQFIDAAQREPVRVLKHDRVIGIMVSVKDYEAMRLFYADRLQHRLSQSAALAKAAGLGTRQLQELLRAPD